jgi:hypothetical protein
MSVSLLLWPQFFRFPITLQVFRCYLSIGKPSQRICHDKFKLNKLRYHNNLFPDVFALSPDAVSQVKDMLIYSISGQLVSSPVTPHPH